MKGMVIFENGAQRLIYHPDFFPHSIFDRLRDDLPWQQNDIRVFGRLHKEPRLTCWFGPAYRYSSIQWPQTPLLGTVSELQQQVSTITSFPFNAVLANYYRNGNDSMGWHSDNEPEIDTRLIASATFGGKRVFKMRNVQTAQKIDIELADRSLLLMYDLQNGWQHSLPKSKTRLAPRINLTFRNVHSV